MQVGDEVTVLSRHGRKAHKEAAGTIIFLNNRQFTIDNGKYKQSFLFNDIKSKQIKVVTENKGANDVALLTIEQARAALPKEKMEALLSAGKKNVEIHRDTGVTEQQYYQLKKEYGLTALTKPGKKNVAPGNGAAKKETQPVEPLADQKGDEPLAFDGLPLLPDPTTDSHQESEQLRGQPPDDKRVMANLNQSQEEQLKLYQEYQSQKENIMQMAERVLDVENHLAKLNQFNVDLIRKFNDIYAQNIEGLQKQIDSIVVAQSAASTKGTETEQLQEELRKTRATLTDLEVYVTEQNKLYEENLEALALQITALKDRPSADNNSGLEFMRHSIAKIKDDFNHHHHQVQHGLFSSKAIV